MGKRAMMRAGAGSVWSAGIAAGRGAVWQTRVAGRMRAGRARVASDYAELFRLCSYLCRVKTQTPLNMQ